MLEREVQLGRLDSRARLAQRDRVVCLDPRAVLEQLEIQERKDHLVLQGLLVVSDQTDPREHLELRDRLDQRGILVFQVLPVILGRLAESEQQE